MGLSILNSLSGNHRMAHLVFSIHIVLVLRKLVLVDYILRLRLLILSFLSLFTGSSRPMQEISNPISFGTLTFVTYDLVDGLLN